MIWTNTLVDNPATEKFSTAIQVLNEATAIEAIKAAHGAYKDWSWGSPTETSTGFLKAADELQKHQEALAKLLCLESGKP
jgi:acyl-CoA reductase-like NAD-dependent aldehyde dehydrogenase